jgi:hypothetical protein
LANICAVGAFIPKAQYSFARKSFHLISLERGGSNDFQSECIINHEFAIIFTPEAANWWCFGCGKAKFGPTTICQSFCRSFIFPSFKA